MCYLVHYSNRYVMCALAYVRYANGQLVWCNAVHI